MRFAIFTHVEHFRAGDSFEAYAPYVREMNIWLKQAEVVEIVAFYAYTGRGQNLPYEHHTLIFTKIPGFNFLSLSSSIKAVLKLPTLFFRIFRAMAKADHLHLRCPGNVGLLACVAQVFFPGKPKTAKYAGNWDPKAKQPWTYKLQRWILNNTMLTRNMKVLVYGEWPGQSKNIISFFTASFSEKTILEAQGKTYKDTYKFLFVGNLVPGKQLEIALKLIHALQEKGLSISLDIYGDGPEKMSAIEYVERKGMSRITFRGSRDLEELKKAYQRSHFLILPSKSEGWPKAVAEAMFFGCIPISTPISCVPWMLGRMENGEWKEERGLLLKVGGPGGGETLINENVGPIMEMLTDRVRVERISTSAKRWSQEYTLEKFEKEIKRII